MAIAVTSPSAKVGFIKNATSANVSGAEIIHAAVAGKKIKIRHLTINSTSAIAITIGAGITGAAVTDALIGPIEFGALSTLQWDFNPLLELPAATLLSVDADGAGVICVFVQGVVE
jgi:hypothetical protein